MLYAAYGSNMNLDQMEFRCPNSKVEGNGILHGWNLVFNVHADIIETNNDDDTVPVVLWNINDDDWNYLDMYEGYPTYYIRKVVDVMRDNGESTQAIVYVMADDMKGIFPPHDSYFNGIIKGCIDNGIDTDYLYDALYYAKEYEVDNAYN